MKTTKLVIALLALLFAAQVNTHAQNWGFALPFGGGGFAINGKNWTAGYGGAVVGGGNRGWGFQLPNGAGFYNGQPGGFGGGGCGYGGGYGGGAIVAPVGAYGGVPAVEWTGQGGYYNSSGWNYGPAIERLPSETAPAVIIRRGPAGSAVYQAESGRVWVRQPY